MSEGIPGSSSPEERQKKEPTVRSSKQLADKMGFVRNPTEKPTTDFRTFEKPISQFEHTVGNETRTITGYEVLEFDDVGRYGPEKEERIKTGVRLGESPFTRWESCGYVQNLLQDENIRSRLPDLVIPKGSVDSFSLSKQGMQSGGYAQLLQLLNTARETGFYAERLQQLRSNMEKLTTTYFENVTGTLFPLVQEYFPKYTEMETDYLVASEANFSVPQGTKSRTPPPLKISLAPDNIYVTFKKGRDFYVVHPPFETMPKDRPHSAWHFQEGDQEDMERTVRGALSALKAKMSEK